MEAITAARVANEERLGFCPGMWEWQKYSRLNGVSLTEWELFAEQITDLAARMAELVDAIDSKSISHKEYRFDSDYEHQCPVAKR